MVQAELDDGSIATVSSFHFNHMLRNKSHGTLNFAIFPSLVKMAEEQKIPKSSILEFKLTILGLPVPARDHAPTDELFIEHCQHSKC